MMEQVGVQVPELVCPLATEESNVLFNPTAPSLCFGEDIYRAVLQYTDGLLELREEV